MSFTNVGKVWSPEQLPAALGVVPKPSWCKCVVLHHTAMPNLAMRHRGFTAQHIENMKAFYQDQGWRGGPHLFADDDQLWGMNDFAMPGVHAKSWNKIGFGIEVLGDYDIESPKLGRGFDCWSVATRAAREVLNWLGLPVNADTVRFHRDEPNTTKTCPGNLVKKEWVIEMIQGHAVMAPKSALPISINGVVVPLAQEIKAGVTYVPARLAIAAILGGDIQSVTGLEYDMYGELTYYGEEIEKAILQGGTAYAPIREICRVTRAGIIAKPGVIEITKQRTRP